MNHPQTLQTADAGAQRHNITQAAIQPVGRVSILDTFTLSKSEGD